VTIFQIFEPEIASWICLAASIVLTRKVVSFSRLRRRARGSSSMSRPFQRLLQIVAIVPLCLRHRERRAGTARIVRSMLYCLTHRHVIFPYLNFMSARASAPSDLVRSPAKEVLAGTSFFGANIVGSEAIRSGLIITEQTSHVVKMMTRVMFSERSKHSRRRIVVPALAKLPLSNGSLDVGSNWRLDATATICWCGRPRHVMRVLLQAIPRNVATRSALAI
jgi:hypothetical protein